MSLQFNAMLHRYPDYERLYYALVLIQSFEIVFGMQLETQLCVSLKLHGIDGVKTEAETTHAGLNSP